MADTEAFKSFDLDQDILTKKYPSVVERYYKRRYRKGVKLDGEDMCILVHTNRVCCLITLAPSHPLIRDGRKVEKVDFQITQETNRLDNKVVGKGKKGGQWLHETSRLCVVTCDDGSVFTVYSGIAGRLVEVNQRLVAEPGLLTGKPETEGFLAIVLVKLQDYDKTMGALMTPDQYEQYLQQPKSGDQSKTMETDENHDVERT